MTVVNPKSISGINSITMASGSDNLLTIHTTNTTERVRVNSDGDVIVGSGITVSPDGDIFATGVTTATTFSGAFSGSGANITALNASNISSGTVPTARLGSGTASSSTFLRGDSTFQTVNTDLVNDTSPQLGGDLDTNDHNILIDDGHAVKFGNDADLEIQHSGSNASVQNSVGHFLVDTTGSFYVRNSTGSKTSILATPSGATELYHDNTKQCETSANGLAFPSGKGIDFSATGGGSNTSSEGELFDDYEEGTVNILIHDAGGSNISVQTNTYKYTKIGNKVYIEGSFVFAETGTKNGGLMVLYNLPFVPTQNGQANGTYWYDGTSDAADVTGVVYVHTNSVAYLKQATTIGQPSNNKYLTFNEIQKNSTRPLYTSFSYITNS